jgi:K+/H+ antiporter YhaU regulatory subunit KhtT
VQNQLADFQKGWEALVSSIDSNTRQSASNSEDLLTINANVQNVENEIQKLSIKQQKLEKTTKSYFDDVEIWTNQTHASIGQIQEIMPEVFNFYPFQFFKLHLKISY